MISKIKPLTITRIGLGIVFLWFGIDKFINPEIWLGLIPNWILAIFPSTDINYMYFHGVIESIIGLLLISGKILRLSSTIAAIILIGIIFSLGYGDLAVRDFGLLTIAIALMVKSYKNT